MFAGCIDVAPIKTRHHREHVYEKATGFDGLGEITRVLPAHKSTLGALCPQGIGQSQAAHHMTGTDFQRGIGTEDDEHAKPQLRRLKPP